MEHQPLTSMVGKKNKQIWEAYQEVLAELAAKEEVASTTSVAEAKKLGEALKVAGTVDVESLENNFESFVAGIRDAKEVFDGLNTAINAKKIELKDVHKLETEVNSLTAIIAAKDILVKEREELCRNMLEEAKEKIEDENRRAVETNTELIESAKAEALKIKADAEKEDELAEKARQQKQEEWDYAFNRACLKKQDDFNDKLKEADKELRERISAVEAREARVDELEQQIERLQNAIETNASLEQERIDLAVEEAVKKAKQSANFEKTMVEKSYEAKLTVANARIEDQNGFIQELRARLDKAEALVNSSNERVTSIATNALKAGADAATVARISEIAAGSGQKK